MKVIKTNSYDESCKIIADEIIALVKAKPNACLGLATGSSPIGIYKRLVEANKNGEVDFSKVSSVNLDEYIGLDGSHDQSYRYFMDTNLFNHINIDKKNTYVANGLGGETAAEEFRQKLENVTIDYQLLGVGPNGHVGFNEPDSALHSDPHIVTLDASTIKANSIYFKSEEEMPKTAITMGMGGILKAKKIAVIVSGNKKDAMAKLFADDKVSCNLPISFLKVHSDSLLVGEKSIFGE